VSEWSKVAGSSDAPPTRNHREKIQPVEIEKPSKSRQRYAGVSQPKPVNLETEHQPRDFGRNGYTDTNRMTEKEVPLELPELVIVNSLIGECPEPRVDAIVSLSIGKRSFNPYTARLHFSGIGSKVLHRCRKIGVKVSYCDARRLHGGRGCCWLDTGSRAELSYVILRVVS
jgi:hypothetical protein